MAGIALPNQTPTMQIAAPLNDVQLVALLAAHRPDDPPAEAVAWAVEVLAEAAVQTQKVVALISKKRGE